MRITNETLVKYDRLSYGQKPSFIIKPDPESDVCYISNGCQFVEDTAANLRYLLDSFNCKSYLDELDRQPWQPIAVVTHGEQMFYGCNSITEFTADMPNLKTGRYMFFRCPIKTFKSDMPKLNTSVGMFFNCHSLESFEADMPKLTYRRSMFEGCNNLTTSRG